MAISRILSWTVISLIPPERNAPPERGATNTRGLPRRNEAGQTPRVPCFVLHHTGFFVPHRLPGGRWALTPPFHPYPASKDRRLRFPRHPNPLQQGGLFSVTLSVTRGFRPASPRILRGVLPGGVRTFLWDWTARRQTNPSDRLPPAAIFNLVGLAGSTSTVRERFAMDTPSASIRAPRAFHCNPAEVLPRAIRVRLCRSSASDCAKQVLPTTPATE